MMPLVNLVFTALMIAGILWWAGVSWEQVIEWCGMKKMPPDER
jgi:hypothetical protein